MIPWMQEHLKQLQVKARPRLRIIGQAAFIHKQRKRKPRKRRVDLAPNTAGIAQWAITTTEGDGTLLVPLPGYKQDEDHPKRLG